MTAWGRANINFLDVLVFQGNPAGSINEFGVSPNGELSFGWRRLKSPERRWDARGTYGEAGMKRGGPKELPPPLTGHRLVCRDRNASADAWYACFRGTTRGAGGLHAFALGAQ